MKRYLKGSVVRPKISLKDNWRTLITAALGIFLSSGLVHAELPVPRLTHQLVQLGTPVAAPDFTLEDIDGEDYSFKDYRGKVVLVNFWASWCPPCRREFPSMEALHQAFKDESFTILAINQWETPDHVFAYMGQLDVFPNFPILFDKDSSVSQAFGVEGLPTTVLVDKQGRIVYQAIGGRDFNHPEVKAIVGELLAAPVAD